MALRCDREELCCPRPEAGCSWDNDGSRVTVVAQELEHDAPEDLTTQRGDPPDPLGQALDHLDEPAHAPLGLLELEIQAAGSASLHEDAAVVLRWYCFSNFFWCCCYLLSNNYLIVHSCTCIDEFEDAVSL